MINYTIDFIIGHIQRRWLRRRWLRCRRLGAPVWRDPWHFAHFRNCVWSCSTFLPAKNLFLQAKRPARRRVAEAVARLQLKYVVLTSVTRDDLPDGGAAHFAATIKAVREIGDEVSVEVLVPDFQGSGQALAAVLAAAPAVLNHNLETVPRLYPAVRPQANYERSLQLLAEVKRLAPDTLSKSGFMVGLGEKRKEVSTLMLDLRKVGCDLVTIGQYLRPSRDHHPVVKYVPPSTFEAYKVEAYSLGFLGVASGPYVRSSYQAESLYRKAKAME